jgi:hypothetical protein
MEPSTLLPPWLSLSWEHLVLLANTTVALELPSMLSSRMQYGTTSTLSISPAIPSRFVPWWPGTDLAFVQSTNTKRSERNILFFIFSSVAITVIRERLPLYVRILPD